jgi:large subunit ribosomal protein L10
VDLARVFVQARREDSFVLGGGEFPLALMRQQKEALVRAYGERLARSQVLIWSRYRGLTVDQFAELRGKLRETGAEAVVVKNTLMRLALEQAQLPVGDELMDGPTVVTFVYDDIAPAASAVAAFAREYTDEFQITGGHVGNQVTTPAGVGTLTTLPTREVLLMQLLGGMQAPVSGLVNVLSGVIRGFVTVLNARSEQLGGSEA